MLRSILWQSRIIWYYDIIYIVEFDSEYAAYILILYITNS